jgi:hypothetical protein
MSPPRKHHHVGQILSRGVWIDGKIYHNNVGVDSGPNPASEQKRESSKTQTKPNHVCFGSIRKELAELATSGRFQNTHLRIIFVEDKRRSKRLLGNDAPTQSSSFAMLLQDTEHP